MDVHVHADRGQIEADGDGEIRGLASDAGEFAEFLDRLREDTAEFLVEDVGERLQVSRLVMVEPDGEDQLLKFCDGELAKAVRGVASRGEKALHCAGGTGVLGAGGENGADEYAEGVVGLRLDELDDRRSMSLEFLLERPVDGGDVLDCHADILSQASFRCMCLTEFLADFVTLNVCIRLTRSFWARLSVRVQGWPARASVGCESEVRAHFMPSRKQRREL